MAAVQVQANQLLVNSAPTLSILSEKGLNRFEKSTYHF